MIKAAVLGSPIAHSLSPVIHQSAYRLLGWDWIYERFEVSSGELPKFLAENSGIFRGLSLTMPLKEEILPLVDWVSEPAKLTNAVNTVVFGDLGSSGFNTDIQGFQDALSMHKVEIPNRASVIGGGATARSAIAALDGAAKTIDVYSRSDHRAKGLVNSARSSIVEIHSWDEVANALTNELVIATTPTGVTDSVEVKKAEGVLFESLYNPWPTKLLANWRAAGGFGIDGLDLLIWQAIGQLEVMSFSDPAVMAEKDELYQNMRADALRALASK